MKNPTGTVFYAIEHCSKAYRKFCQKNIDEAGLNITVDQGLILLVMSKSPSLTQSEVADLVFKDYASMTRIIKLMEAKGYLKRATHKDDKRRAFLEITQKGKDTVTQLDPVVQSNRTSAAKGLTKDEQMQLAALLQKITTNCLG